MGNRLLASLCVHGQCVHGQYSSQCVHGQNGKQERNAEISYFGCFKGQTSHLPFILFRASGTDANKIGSKKGSRRDLAADVLKGKPPACLSVCSRPEGGREIKGEARKERREILLRMF